MMRQIAGSFAEYEKARLVAKLKAAWEQAAHDRQMRRQEEPCRDQSGDGADRQGLRRRKRGNSLRAIAADLAARGYLNVNGRAFSAASVASMLGA
jgi:DNA invertase Pin-like site-specific DNA recombinase